VFEAPSRYQGPVAQSGKSGELIPRESVAGSNPARPTAQEEEVMQRKQARGVAITGR
jgi:hypothetical protein